MSCAGLITVNYKLAVARTVAEDFLPRVGDDLETARSHMQRTLNALTAPGKKATAENTVAAEHEGYHEIEGVVGNPVHGMPDKEVADAEGMGIIPHLKKHTARHPHVKDAVSILEFARQYAARCIQGDDAATIKRGGRVVAYMLRAAQEAIN